MSQTVLDDDRSSATEEQFTPATYAPLRRAAMKKVIPIAVILSITAILISSGACTWVVFHDPLGKGISEYDFSTPKDGLISELEIELNTDIRAQFELMSLSGNRELEEKLKTLKVHKEAEWQGKKVLFISYEQNGIKEYDTEGSEKDAETGFWTSAYVGAYAVKDDNERLAAMITEWEERGSDASSSSVPFNQIKDSTNLGGL